MDASPPTPAIVLGGERDTLFAGNHYPKPFCFNAEVADVFDDMADRSIPYYRQVITVIAQWARAFCTPRDRVYDLGCSTGTTVAYLAQVLPDGTQFIAVDQSEPMIAKARHKLTEASHRHHVQCVHADLEQQPIEGAGLVILNYTLQFIPVARRRVVLERVFRGLRPGGLLVVSEKIQSAHPECQEAITRIYEDFKHSQGYSTREIEKKKEALEQVLVPLTAADQERMLRDAGFAHVEVGFRWNNFATFMALKSR